VLFLAENGPEAVWYLGAPRPAGVTIRI